MAEKRHLQHVRSKVVEGGKPKLPESSALLYGELAINYAKDYETISLKNENGEIISFYDEVQVTEGIAPKPNTEIWIDTSASSTTEVYTREQVDSKVGQLNTRMGYVESGFTLQNEKLDEFGNEISTLSSKTDNNIIIGDSATTKTQDTEIWVDTTAVGEPYEVYTKAQVDVMIANLQRQIDELKG